MHVTVEKLTDITLLREACDSTRQPGGAASTMSLRRAYQCEHSPARTQLFKIVLEDVPVYVSTHFIRHAAVGQQHYARTFRSDRGGSDNVGRLQPTYHTMILNAQHLLDMSQVRLCFNADKRTVGVMVRLKSAVRRVDPDLADFMAPRCVVRGYCPELRPCDAGPVQVIRAYRDSPHVLARNLTQEQVNA